MPMIVVCQCSGNYRGAGAVLVARLRGVGLAYSAGLWGAMVEGICWFQGLEVTPVG